MSGDGKLFSKRKTADAKVRKWPTRLDDDGRVNNFSADSTRDKLTFFHRSIILTHS